MYLMTITVIKNANNTQYYVVKDGKDKGNIVCISHRKRIDYLK